MKEIVGFPMYTLHKDGKVFSKYTSRFLKPTTDTTGYPIVILVNKSGKFKKSVHRLLAECYLPNPSGKPQVNHKDGDKTNHSLENLEWVTAKENSKHAIETGLTKVRDEARYIPVLKLSLDTGEVLGEYPSVTFAAKTHKIAQPNLTKVCKGQRKSAGGFGWSFK